MKLLRTIIAVGIIWSLLLLSLPAFAAGPGNGQDFAQGRILVKFQAGIDEGGKREVQGRHGDYDYSDITRLGVRVLKVPAGKELEKLAAYRGEKAIEFAEPDYIARAIGTPNDPYFANQWGMTKIQAPQAWDVTTGLPGVRIAILDTGVDQNNEDLAAKIVANMNETTSITVDDLYGHGTHVAGIAAAITNNGLGVAGVGYNCSIMNVKVLDDTGSGYYSWIANGITWAADNGAKVINMSLGGSAGSSTLQTAVDYAWGKGVVIVAAAGNGGNTAPSYPGYYSNVIAVAATDNTDAKASFSTYGSWVDVAAPGVNIFSTLPNHSNQIGGLNYGYLSGTSMATPFVSGLAGLVWSTSYGMDNTSVRNRIQSTADPIGGTGTHWQNGRINAYKAVLPSTPVPPSLSVAVVAPALTRLTSFTVQTTVANSGTTTATGATATITLPSGLSTAESLTKALGDIGGGSSATTSWSVSASADGRYSITVLGAATNAPAAGGTATSTVDTAPPDQVNGLAVTTVSGSQLRLGWNANTESDLNHYNVYRSSVSGSGYTLVASPNTNSYLNTGLTAATTYYYVVSAVDNAGNEGARSAQASGTTNSAKMHVQSISMALGQSSGYTRALATVTILDAAGRPVPGVTVSGRWTAATSSTTSGVTNTSGQVTLQSGRVRRPRSGTTFTFAVTNVQLSGWSYDSASNIVTSASITVP